MSPPIGAYYIINIIVILGSPGITVSQVLKWGYYTINNIIHQYSLNFVECSRVSRTKSEIKVMDNRKKAAIAIVLAFALKSKRKRKRWVKDWMLKRNDYTHLNITQEMILGDDLDDYSNYFRMSEDLFETLLTLVSHVRPPSLPASY